MDCLTSRGGESKKEEKKKIPPATSSCSGKERGGSGFSPFSCYRPGRIGTMTSKSTFSTMAAMIKKGDHYLVSFSGGERREGKGRNFPFSLTSLFIQNEMYSGYHIRCAFRTGGGEGKRKGLIIASPCRSRAC